MFRLCLCLLIGWGISGQPQSAVGADWNIEAESNVFYTDDVALFSAARRLSVQEDPTQPVVDVTGQGEDVVFDPALRISRSVQSKFGKTELSARAQGFIFVDKSVFNHGTYGLGLTHQFPHDTKLAFRYHYGPNLFLGNNRERRTGAELEREERVTTHFGAAFIERPVVSNVNLRLYGRYGLRLYNEAFRQRDTKFWTIGPHLEWKITPRVGLMLGYHYERGHADGRNHPQFNDDISYINHYVSSELRILLMDRTSLLLAVHFERNDFTSDLEEDEWRGAQEKVIQGDAEIRYDLNEAIDLTLGFQRSQRKTSFEAARAIDHNAWIGSTIRF